MARRLLGGAEQNSLTADVEFDNIVGSPEISTTTVRTGTYSLKAVAGSVNTVRLDTGSGVNSFLYARTYINIEALPAAITDILSINQASSNTQRSRIRLATDGTLELWNTSGKIGSSSSALSTGTWYMVELSYRNITADGDSHTEGRLNGISFASTTDSTTTGTAGSIRFGNITGVSSFIAYFDDWALNEDTGSDQSSWPGSEKIYCLRPNGAGDNADWTRGGADSGANWSQVDEVTPNGATDYVEAADTTTLIDDYTLENITLTNETVTVVAVCHNGSEGNDRIKLRIKASSGGTVEETGNLNVTGQLDGNYYTIQSTNKLPKLVLYNLPGASTDPWTETDLNNAQVGVQLSANFAGSTTCKISALWLLVATTPSSSPTSGPGTAGAQPIFFG